MGGQAGRGNGYSGMAIDLWSARLHLEDRHAIPQTTRQISW
jgi:hypothetical protein